MHKIILEGSDGADKGRERGESENPAYKHCGQILIHPYHSYKIEGLCLHCSRRRDNLLANFEVNAIRDTVYRESMSGPAYTKRKFGSFSPCADGDNEGRAGTEGAQALNLLPVHLKQPMPTLSLFQNLYLQVEGARVEQQQQQQQTPWRLTLPPAEVPKNGWGLAGMREGEWI
jgi:hypothetical protein